jgi:predicted ATPase
MRPKADDRVIKASSSSRSLMTAPTASSSGVVSRTDSSLLPALNFSNLTLVGRSKEQTILQKAYERVCKPKASSEIVLVRGASGEGKSALIQSSLEKQAEIFIAGKNFQFEERPYGAIVDAMTELCYLIESNPKREAYQKSIREHLSLDECSSLAKLIPSFQIIVPAVLKQQADTSSIPKNEYAFHCIQVLLRTLLTVVCSMTPVVMFLDDLQWSDAASQKVISSLAADSCLTNLLLVGAIRDGDDDQEFKLSLDSTAHSVMDITLGPLDEASVNEIVARVTEQRQEQTTDLSAVILAKTGGNAYFVIQYLEMLYQQGLLVFSFGSSRWEWDVQAIQNSTNVSDNVVQLLIQKISDLPKGVHVILMIAATLGFRFDVDILGTILESKDFNRTLSEIPSLADVSFSPRDSDSNPERSIEHLLGLAVTSDLVEKLTLRQQFKFSHDRVQQSVLEMFPDREEGAQLRASLGEVILKLSRSDGSEEWMLLTAVDLLTKHPDRNSHGAEELAQLCLEVARVAHKRSAFQSAAEYAVRGLGILNTNDPWRTHFDLCLELSQMKCVSQYSYGEIDGAMESADELLRNTKQLNDKLRAYSVRVAILGARKELHAALMESMAVLQLLGLKLPRNPTNFHIRRAAARVKRLLGGRKAKDLVNLPHMTDPYMIEATRLLANMSTYSWRSGADKMLFHQVYVIMELTLTAGLGPFGPMSLALYGCLLADSGELDEAFYYGEVALKLAQHPAYKEGRAHTLKVVHLITYHIKKPAAESLPAMLKAFTIAKEIGNVEIAGYCLQAHGMFGVVVGMTLQNLEMEFRSHCQFCREFHLDHVLSELLPFYQLTLNLMGQSENPLVLSGSGMVEEDFVSDILASKEGSAALLMLVYARMIVLYLFGELKLADIERRKLNPQKDIVGTYFMKYVCYFFGGMICLGLARNGSKRHRKHAQGYFKALKALVKAGCMTFVPMLKLLEAEQLALDDRTGDTEKVYQTAISMSSRSGSRLVKAIACERAGEYMILCGQVEPGKEYLEKAVAEYTEYGAYVKVAQVERKYQGQITFTVEAASKSTSSSKLQAYIVEKWDQTV